MMKWILRGIFDGATIAGGIGADRDQQRSWLVVRKQVCLYGVTSGDHARSQARRISPIGTRCEDVWLLPLKIG